MPLPVFADTRRNGESPPYSSGMTPCAPNSCLTRSGLASGLSILFSATTMGTLAALAWRIGSIGCGMTPSSAATTRVTRAGACCPRGAGPLLCFPMLGGIFEIRLGIVESGGGRLVAHFLDHDHGAFLVEDLIDGHHLAELHQYLDYLRRLPGHLVREVGYGDGLRYVHLAGYGLGGGRELVLRIGSGHRRGPTRRPVARTLRAVPARGALDIAAGLDRASLGALVLPDSDFLFFPLLFS